MSPMTPLIEGGWPVWAVLFLTLVGLLAGGLSLFLSGSAGRASVFALGAVALMAGLMVAGVGVAGWLYNRAQVDEAVLYADPASAELIRSVGYAESSWALWCGMAGAAPALLMGAVTTVRGALRRDPSSTGRRD